MKIIQGKYKGRRFGPVLDSIRPTSSFNREVLVNILRSNFPDQLESARVLDLFAGTGALAFELLSAGAAEAVLVEKSRSAVQAIQRNIEILSIAESVRVYNRSAEKFSSDGRFNVLLLDPPYLYSSEALRKLVERLLPNFAPEAIIALESSTHLDILTFNHFELRKSVKKGDTRLSFFQLIEFVS
jgi:16S rRNA (guanine(966)-N(2))-methyltransferase RsmD